MPSTIMCGLVIYLWIYILSYPSVSPVLGSTIRTSPRIIGHMMYKTQHDMSICNFSPVSPL